MYDIYFDANGATVIQVQIDRSVDDFSCVQFPSKLQHSFHAIVSRVVQAHARDSHIFVTAPMEARWYMHMNTYLIIELKFLELVWVTEL